MSGLNQIFRGKVKDAIAPSFLEKIPSIRLNIRDHNHG